MLFPTAVNFLQIYLSVLGSGGDIQNLEKRVNQFENGCILPDQPEGGSYITLGCNECNSTPGNIVPFQTVLKFSCSKSYILTEKYKYAHCFEFTGNWDPTPPQCIKTCCGVSTNDLELTCSYKMSNVSCRDNVVVGTVMRPRCKQNYRIADPKQAFKETQCLPGGIWGQPLFDYCGRPDEYEIDMTKITHPWLSFLFYKDSKDNNEIRQVYCLGTLISTSIVITAAHCLISRDPQFRNTNVPAKPGAITVIIGHINYNTIKRSDYEKFKRNVIQVILHPGFLGMEDKYKVDIGLLKLERGVVIRRNVMPICFDYKIRFRSNQTGFISAWNRRDFDFTIYTQETKGYGFLSCRPLVNRKWQAMMSFDSFCAVFNNGMGPTYYGSSGGVFSVKENGHFFITGLVSRANVNESIAVFVAVHSYYDWIKSTMDLMKESEPDFNHFQSKELIAIPL